MHAFTPGEDPPRRLTPDEVAQRQERIAQRQERIRRKAERTHGRRPDPPRGMWARLAAWTVLPGLAFVVIVISGVFLPAALHAARGEGTRGSFIAQQQAGTGSRVGTFTSDGGQLIVHNVDYAGPASSARSGSTVVATYSGGARVYPWPGSTAWIRLLFLILIGAGIFSWWLWIVPFNYRRQGKLAPEEQPGLLRSDLVPSR